MARNYTFDEIEAAYFFLKKILFEMKFRRRQRVKEVKALEAKSRKKNRFKFHSHL